MTPVSYGKPCAGNPHARFDEGASASEEPRRKALLHIKPAVTYACIFAALAAAAGETRINAIGEKSRGEIVEFFTDNEFGRRPTAVDKAEVSFEKMSEDRLMPDGKMVRRQSRVVYKGPYGTKSFPVTAFIPAGAKGSVPAFLLVCNRNYAERCDPERNAKSPFFPVEEIVARGFAAVSFFNGDVAPDYNTGNTKGVFECFEKAGPYRNGRLWGTISAWAWGASRVLDWLETVPEIDAKRVAVVGHSRGGKTALWAAVTDSRFAMVCVNGSGCAGAKLNHLDLPKSEHIAQIVRTFQYWFCLDYTLWANREREMPFDQHELLSCVAPRLLAVGSGSEDRWAGPEGERKATELARAAWDDPSRVSYHVHPGKHDLGLYDWNVYLSHATKFWKKPAALTRAAEPVGGGGFRVLVYGNSIALHGPKPDIGWTNSWGMAASAREKDFAHLVVAGLEAKLGKKADSRIRNVASLERNFTTNVATVAEIAADAKWAPDYVVIALGENVPAIDASNAAAYTKFIADIARPFADAGAKVVLRSPFWMNATKAECTAAAAADTGCVYVDAGPLGFDDENKAIGLFSHSGVANHPGDLGMSRLAELVLAGFAAAEDNPVCRAAFKDQCRILE